jgi:hypothetical protein
MKKLTLTLALALFSLNAIAFSRGPYLPQTQTLLAPVGEVLFQVGFGEDPSYDRVEWDEVNEELNYIVDGEVIIKLPNGQFEVAVFEYSCVAIDDGAYGALSCDSATYVQGQSRFYKSCEFSTRWNDYYCE